MIQGTSIVYFPSHGDERGSLVAVESGRDIPFDVKRVYYIYGTQPNVVRGRHAHKDINQIILCVHGNCDIFLDNGEEQCVLRLDKPNEGVYIHGFIWREMFNFSEDCVLLVLVDRYYDPDDYEYDREELKK